MESKQERVFDLLEATELNWTVNKMPLITECGKQTESYGMFRNDNNKWLATVGKQYRVFQNYEMAELLVNATDGLGLQVKLGGELQDGKKVFMQIPLRDKTVGTDTVKRNITCLNSHDGTSSIGFGSTNTVVICQNTFFQAMKDKSMSKVRHSTNSKERLQIMMKDLRVAIGLDEELFRKFEVMADTPITQQLFENVIGKAFEIKADAKKDDISTRKENQLIAFNSVLNSELDSHGKTVWGLFNAMTYYTNHIEPSNLDEKESNIMVGAGFKKNLLTFEECMKWIEANTVPSKMEYVING